MRKFILAILTLVFLSFVPQVLAYTDCSHDDPANLPCLNPYDHTTVLDTVAYVGITTDPNGLGVTANSRMVFYASNCAYSYTEQYDIPEHQLLWINGKAGCNAGHYSVNWSENWGWTWAGYYFIGWHDPYMPYYTGTLNGSAGALDGTMAMWDSTFYWFGAGAPVTTYQLTVSSNPVAGGGVASSDSEIQCGVNQLNYCQYDYPLNSEVELTAYPNEGYVFAYWDINEGAGSSTNNPETFTMDGALEVTAKFHGIRYPLDYTLGNNNGWSHAVQSFGSLNNNSGGPHAGEDWNKNTGTCTDAGEPIYAIADGTLKDNTNDDDAWGRTILIQHDAPTGYYFLTGTGEKLSTAYSLYAHMLSPYQTGYGYVENKDIQVDEEDPIKYGDPVGQVGDGNGEYPGACHLHFAILTDASKVTTYRNGAYGWSVIQSYTDPSELINNGFYSDTSTKFSIFVHPYECSGTFVLSGNTPDCDAPTSVIGNWTRNGNSYNLGSPELGYGGIIYSKDTSLAGTAYWHPNLPKDGQYKVWVYIPDNTTYATSANATYTVSDNGNSNTPVTIDQGADHSSTKNWVDIGTYGLHQNSNPFVELQGSTGETGKIIAVDAVKFEYIGLIQ